MPVRGDAFSAIARVSPDVTVDPINVVLWIRDNVSAQDQADIVADIEAGLAMWEGIATSHLRFQTEVIVSPTEPATVPEDLLVIIAYNPDLPKGGASLPSSGCPAYPFNCPGTWFGAVADASGPIFPLVAAHEIGHALGILHSSIGTLEFSTNIPIMHWALAGVVGLTDDDIAAASHLYPSTTTPLASVTGTITGRLVSQSTGLPIDGINVVAVDGTTGDPSIAQLTGVPFDVGASPTPGEFNLIGLPPGTSTDVRLLDGQSFAGSSYGMSKFAFQAHNFTSTTLGPFLTAAGSTIAIGDVALTIEPISIDGIGLGPDPDPADLDPLDGLLPPGIVGQEYEAYLHLRGGVRPLEITDFYLPLGFSAFLINNRVVNADANGDLSLYLYGIPNFGGQWPTFETLTDDHGVEGATQVFGLVASDPCAPSLGADADADGVCDDGAGNGFPIDQPCAGGQTVGCDDNCRFVPNPLQLDSDSNGFGDACDGPPGSVLIDFETLPDGTVLPPNFTFIALDAFTDLGLRVSPSISTAGGPFKSINNGYLSTPDPSGFSGHYVSKTSNSRQIQLNFSPPVTHAEFDWASSNSPIRVIATDLEGDVVSDTLFDSTTTIGLYQVAGHAALNFPTRVVTLRMTGANSGSGIWIDNLEYTQTACAVGLDPDGDGTCSILLPEPSLLAMWICGGLWLTVLHCRRHRRI